MSKNQCASVEELWNVFKHEVQTGVQKWIPHLSVKKKRWGFWLTVGTKRLIAKSNRLYKKASITSKVQKRFRLIKDH